MLGEFPFIALWSTVSDYTANGGDIEQSVALENLVRKHRQQLLNPNPFPKQATSTAVR